MKSTHEILKFVIDRLQHIYDRPLMYGGTAMGVDLVLHYYNELWAEIVERSGEYEALREEVFREENCGSGGFACKFLKENPSAPESEAASYVVQQWQEIHKRLTSVGL